MKEREEVEQGSSTRGKEVQQGIIIDQVDRVIVPRDTALRAKLVLEVHKPLFCGHFGARRTQDVICRNFWWPELCSDVDRIVRMCDVCQRVQSRRRGDEAPIEVIVAEGPWQVVMIAFLSGFVPSVLGGWQGCVVVCNRFSRIMYLKEYNTHPTAKEAAALFI